MKPAEILERIPGLKMGTLQFWGRTGKVHIESDPDRDDHYRYEFRDVKARADRRAMLEELQKSEKAIAPTEGMQIAPWVNQTMLTKWYTWCPPHKRGLKTYPENPGPSEKRLIDRQDFIDAIRWYRADLPDEFVDEDSIDANGKKIAGLGPLIFVEKFARDAGRDKSAVYGWSNPRREAVKKGEIVSPAAGGCPYFPNNEPLELFTFRHQSSCRHREYLRKSDGEKIKNF